MLVSVAAAVSPRGAASRVAGARVPTQGLVTPWRALRRPKVVRAQASGIGDAPATGSSPPAFTNRLDKENWSRVQTMTDRGLRARMRRITNTEKLASFVRVLEASGKVELAAEARQALAARLPAAAPLQPPAAPGSQPPLATGSETSSKASGGQTEDAEEHRKERLQRAQMEATARKLEAKGMEVFLPAKSSRAFDWGTLAGYEDVKRQVEETLVLALSHPEVYEEIARSTRHPQAAKRSSRPRAVLFEGPPGTGKTTCARALAQQGCVPLVNLRFEAVFSKWYGEDERNLADVLRLCEAFPTGAVVFLDELDSMVTSRDDQLHEVTRRMLGILLRHLDGLTLDTRTVFIGATNRQGDLDAALRSRFTTTITFALPDEDSRVAILEQYAHHLCEGDLRALARATPGMAGRDLLALCEHTERRWASEIIRGRLPKGRLPSVMVYLSSAQQRQREMKGREEKRSKREWWD